MTHLEVLEKATECLMSLGGEVFDVLEISKPETDEYSLFLSKIVSKLSPMVGNMIEYKVCEELNSHPWADGGKWIRQDPGFPDTVFIGNVSPIPGIEIKTWFPLATEITARFKDSVTHFEHEQTLVAVVAWLPEHLIHGKPRIIDVWVGSAKELAMARDLHYHRPPDYIVFEPRDTAGRTRNLQQSNTNGYKFQGSLEELEKAKRYVKGWGKNGIVYSSDTEYQAKLEALQSRFPYRLDTNFAKMDRIQHTGLESFKTRVMNTEISGKSITAWCREMKGLAFTDEVQEG